MLSSRRESWQRRLALPCLKEPLLRRRASGQGLFRTAAFTHRISCRKGRTQKSLQQDTSIHLSDAPLVVRRLGEPQHWPDNIYTHFQRTWNVAA